MLARHIYKDVESYHTNIQKNYYEKIPGLYELIKDKQVFYIAEPHYKNVSRTKSIVQIIKIEHGLD